MKAVWKGYIKCSLVTIPVKMYRAVAPRAVQFVLLHKECGNRIRQERVCPVCRKPLGADEITRAYHYGKDRYIPINDEDLAKARKESSEVIDILKFVDAAQVPPLYYEEAHYLLPDGTVGRDAFALLYQVLRKMNKNALARQITRQREHLMGLSPYNGTLIGYRMHYPAEIVQPEALEGAREIAGLTLPEDQLKLAQVLVENLSGDFVASDYTDDYTQTLLELIQAKAVGAEVPAAPQAERRKVINLMTALQQSVKATAGEGGLPAQEMAAAGKRRGKVDNVLKKA
jgi:DNA end-binding protein Ku